MKKKIAIIPPFEARDVLGDTVIDGFIDLVESGEPLTLAFPSWYSYPTSLDLGAYALDEKGFLSFAADAHLIILISGKRGTNTTLAEKIGLWKRTVFIDGTEVGKNRRYDPAIQYEILKGTFAGNGRIQADMLARCSAYFRREKPYTRGITPLPFGIERRYAEKLGSGKKDIDIACIFGQTEYPPLRKQATDFVREFAEKHKLVACTTVTEGFGYDDSKNKGRDVFYDILARSKVGISIGGGGFDTARFWEILANDCILLTEKIDIFPSGDSSLRAKRIIEFSSLYDLEQELERLLPRLVGNSYIEILDPSEYTGIMRLHSSRARANKILEVYENPQNL